MAFVPAAFFAQNKADDPSDIRLTTSRGSIILSDATLEPGNVPIFKTDIDNRTDTEWHNLAIKVVARGTCNQRQIELKFRAQLGTFTPFGASSAADNIIPLASHFGEGCSFDTVTAASLDGGEALKDMESRRAETLRTQFERADREVSEKAARAKETAESVRNISNQGPFGFRYGMTREQVIQLVGKQSIKDSTDDALLLTAAPKPHPAFEAYILFISPTKGVLKIVASGKKIATNGFGAELHDAFTELRDTVAMTYGTPATHDFLKAGSIWDERRDWMTGLLKKERTLSAFWDLRTLLPNHIQDVYLDANALSSESGYLSLGYEFDGWDEYVTTKKEKAGKVF